MTKATNSTVKAETKEESTNRVTQALSLTLDALPATALSVSKVARLAPELIDSGSNWLVLAVAGSNVAAAKQATELSDDTRIEYDKILARLSS